CGHSTSLQGPRGAFASLCRTARPFSRGLAFRPVWPTLRPTWYPLSHARRFRSRRIGSGATLGTPHSLSGRRDRSAWLCHCPAAVAANRQSVFGWGARCGRRIDDRVVVFFLFGNAVPFRAIV